MRLTLFLVLGFIALIVPGSQGWFRRIRFPIRLRPKPTPTRIPPSRLCWLGKRNTRTRDVGDDFKDSLMKGFKILDRNNDQLIEGEELENFSEVFPNLGMPARELLSTFDTNKDGTIDFDELASGFIKQIDNGYTRKDDQPSF